MEKEIKPLEALVNGLATYYDSQSFAWQMSPKGKELHTQITDMRAAIYHLTQAMYLIKKHED